MAVSFTEMQGSNKLRISERGFDGTRVFKIDWADRLDFAKELLGAYEQVGDQIVSIPPATYPGFPQAICTAVNIEPFDSDNPGGGTPTALDDDAATYAGGARVTATYTAKIDPGNNPTGDEPAVPDGTFLRWTSTHHAEVMQVPGHSFQFLDDDGDPFDPVQLVDSDASVGIVIAYTDHVLEWTKVPVPPFAAIRALTGAVNHDTFLGAAAETLLFMGAEWSREFQATDEIGFWTLRYTFSEVHKFRKIDEKVGWNHFYKRQAQNGISGRWLKVSATGTNTQPPFKLTTSGSNFTALFQPGP